MLLLLNGSFCLLRVHSQQISISTSGVLKIGMSSLPQADPEKRAYSQDNFNHFQSLVSILHNWQYPHTLKERTKEE